MVTEKATPQRTVPNLHFHGSEDGAVPYQGGKGKLDVTGTNLHSVDYTMQKWIEVNGCDKKPTHDLPDTARYDGTMVTQTVYGGCRDEAEIQLFTVKGGGLISGQRISSCTKRSGQINPRYFSQ